MKKFSDLLLTLTIVLCSAVLLGGLLFAILGNPLHRPELEFSVDFRDVTGIRVNSDVVYAGAPVGTVTQIDYLPAAERIEDDALVRLTLAIHEPVEIPKNVQVRLATPSMLGEPHVAIVRSGSETTAMENGDRLVASPSANMLESMVPGAADILANLDDTVKNLKTVTGRLASGEDGENLSTMIASLSTTADGLRVAFEGDGSSDPGISAQLQSLAGNLDATSQDLRLLIGGDGTEENPGLDARTHKVFDNIDEFTEELAGFLVGSEDRPGLQESLNSIAREVELLLAGESEEEALRNRMGSVLGRLDELLVETQTLMVWGQYFAGSLAEKPNRLIFSGKSDHIPTKDDILRHLETDSGPYPVQIRARDERSDDEERVANRLRRSRDD